MYYNQPFFTNDNSAPLVYLYCQQPFVYCLPDNSFLTGFDASIMDSQLLLEQGQLERPLMNLEKSTQFLKEKAETCESLELLQDRQKSIRKFERPVPSCLNQSSQPKTKEVKLNYRIQWRNENRNIVPNLINQMISYLLKPSKSMRIVQRLFARLPHREESTQAKYFQYVKKIKESITHYVNESVFLQFLEIHEPNCDLYTFQEQLFYMKVCRIVILSFLRNEIKLISLTSKRMSQAKRKIHLIAREALATKFLELCRQNRA